MAQQDALRDGGPARGGDRDALVRQVAAAIRAMVRLGYFTLEVEGAEHLPREGAVVYAQNHAGWFALDTFILGHAVGETLGLSRAPYFAAHESALAAPVIGPFLRRLGGLPASWFRNPERLPPEIGSYGICPEGVRGNCKPFWEAYRMRPWNRGFVRVAIARQCPIVPVAILGGEECLPVAWTVRALEPFVGSVLGLPLSPVPLPTRWKLVFHEPIELGAGREALTDQGYCSAVARHVQAIVQRTLDREARSRLLGRLSSMVELLGHGPGELDDPLAGAPPLPRPPDESSRLPVDGSAFP